MIILHGKNRFLLEPILFDVKERKFEEINLKGEKPEKRVNATCNFVEQFNKVFLFGGLDSDGFSSNLIYSLDVSHFVWKKLSPSFISKTDFGVHFHSSVYGENGFLYFFGGKKYFYFYFFFYIFFLIFLFFILLFFKVKMKKEKVTNL